MLLYNPVTGKSLNVPDIDAPGWINLMGYSTSPPKTVVEPLQLPLPNPVTITPEAAVLAFINAAEKTYQLTPIPSVGHAAAKAILEARPEGGYQSLDDLGPILPLRSSLESIKKWMPS